VWETLIATLSSEMDYTEHISTQNNIDVERVQKGIAHWDKQNNNVPAPNCMLKVWGEKIKDKDYK